MDPQQQTNLLGQCSLREGDKPTIAVQTTEDVLQTLDSIPLKTLADRIAALPTRFAQVKTEVAKQQEPKAQVFQLPRRTLKTEEEVDQWIQDVNQQLKTVIANGPVILQ